MCQSLSNQLVENLINQGKSYHYIFVILNGLRNAKDIEILFDEQNIELPQSKKQKIVC